MPIYLDFINISIRINTDIPTELLGTLPGHYFKYWFIKFGNSYGPNVLSGLLSETSNIPLSGLLNSKGLDTVSTDEMRGQREYALSNEGGEYKYAFPISINGLFNFTVYLSTSESVLMMAPISIIINGDDLRAKTGSRLIDVFRKYQKVKTSISPISSNPFKPRSEMLYYIDLDDNIVKSGSNKYAGCYSPMSSTLSIAPTSEIMRSYNNVIFTDPITDISLAINRYIYEQAVSDPNPGKPYLQNKNFNLPFIDTLLRFENKPMKTYPINVGPRYENFTDRFTYGSQPEAMLVPELEASAFLKPSYDNDPNIDTRVNNEFTHDDSIYMPYPDIQDSINLELADRIITNPSLEPANMMSNTNTMSEKSTSNTTSVNNIWIIIILIVIAVAISIVVILGLKKKFNKIV